MKGSHEGTKARSGEQMDGNVLSETLPLRAASPRENTFSFLRAFVASCETIRANAQSPLVWLQKIVGPQMIGIPAESKRGELFT